MGWFYPGEYDCRLLPHVKQYVRENGVRIFAFRNSPNVHAAYGYVHPSLEVNHPVIERHFRKALKTFQPDLVHFHDFGGLCSSLISIASDLSLITVNSLHSYWFICPKNDLIFTRTGQICPGPEAGNNCSLCITPSTRRVAMARIQATIWQTAKAVVPHKLLSLLQPPIVRLYHRWWTPGQQRRVSVAVLQNQELISAYGERERNNLRLLCDRVTMNIAVSTFVKQRFVEWGVPPERLIVQHIGTRAAEFLKPVAREIKMPVTFGYIGPLTYHKGAHTLVDAFNLLDSNLETRLIVYGDNGSQYAEGLKQRVRNGAVQFRPRYRHEDLQEILKEIDVVVVPPIWYDNAPQVVFESLSAGVPVIGARIGGIPDFVRDGENGILYEAGNAEDLAKKMTMVARDPSLILRMRTRIRTMKTMIEHVEELLSLYESLIQ